jgi:hypothetical protein
VSVSVPFFTESLQAGATQGSAVQTLLEQSDGWAQALVAAHGEQSAPPQSMSVSLPFLMRSVQPAATHFFVPAVSQCALAQSAFAAHDFVFAHFVAHVPPQSVSVSVPFLIESLHAGATHFFETLSQFLLAQSAASAQPFVSAHAEHVPPQSMSVSVPFLMPSPQEMARQVPPVPQRLLVQSAAAEQALPSAHFVEQDPPQSTSVSLPFFVASVQLAAAHLFAVHTPVAQSPAFAQP